MEINDQDISFAIKQAKSEIKFNEELFFKKILESRYNEELSNSIHFKEILKNIFDILDHSEIEVYQCSSDENGMKIMVHSGNFKDESVLIPKEVIEKIMYIFAKPLGINIEEC